VRRDSGRIRRYGSRTAGLVDRRRRLASLPGLHREGFESRAVELVFAVGWAAFWLYWILAAFSMKKGRIAWSRELRIRLVIVAVAILLVRLGVFRGYAANADPWHAGIGLVLFALGLGLAVWARVHLGRNWGTPMTQKVEPELGPAAPTASHATRSTRASSLRASARP
jgi:hypothetical protein